MVQTGPLSNNYSHPPDYFLRYRLVSQIVMTDAIMQTQTTGKTALIAGAASGIGRELSTHPTGNRLR